MQYYKFTTLTELTHGYQWTTGLNKLKGEFIPDQHGEGALHVFSREQLNTEHARSVILLSAWVRIATQPEGAQWVEHDTYYRCDQVIVGERVKVEDFRLNVATHELPRLWMFSCISPKQLVIEYNLPLYIVPYEERVGDVVTAAIKHNSLSARWAKELTESQKELAARLEAERENRDTLLLANAQKGVPTW